MNIPYQHLAPGRKTEVVIATSDFIDLLNYKLRILQEAQDNPHDDWDYGSSIKEILSQISELKASAEDKTEAPCDHLNTQHNPHNN